MSTSTKQEESAIDPLEMFFGTENMRYSFESKSSEERDRTFSATSIDSVDLELVDIENRQKQGRTPSKGRAIAMTRKREAPSQELVKTPTPSKYYTMLQTNRKVVEALTK